ncbi:MAG: YkgJ family cysteine cluster protein [Planctomycetes bacterium]|nr:YkgJ family cysteine cluster protein [Planctomycetota bacterium]
MPPDFHCTRCGHCCEQVDTASLVSEADLARWTSEGRMDILNFRDRCERLWYDPHPKPPGCPFLRTVRPGLHACAIHESKPERCSRFPEMVVESGRVERISRWASEHCPGVASMLSGMPTCSQSARSIQSQDG